MCYQLLILFTCSSISLFICRVVSASSDLKSVGVSCGQHTDYGALTMVNQVRHVWVEMCLLYNCTAHAAFLPFGDAVLYI